jgi:hypothetical protein
VKEFICDRCGRELDTSNERSLLQVEQAYPGRHICPGCDLLVVLAKETILKDILGNLPVGTTAALMLDNYE